MMNLHIGDGLLRGCLTSTGCLHDVYDHPLDGDLHIGDGMLWIYTSEMTYPEVV
jgi:hypothetical protein